MRSRSAPGGAGGLSEVPLGVGSAERDGAGLGDARGGDVGACRAHRILSIMQKIRDLDKLVDELSKGKPERIVDVLDPDAAHDAGDRCRCRVQVSIGEELFERVSVAR